MSDGDASESGMRLCLRAKKGLIGDGGEKRERKEHHAERNTD